MLGVSLVSWRVAILSSVSRCSGIHSPPPLTLAFLYHERYLKQAPLLPLLGTRLFGDVARVRLFAVIQEQELRCTPVPRGKEPKRISK